MRASNRIIPPSEAHRRRVDVGPSGAVHAVVRRGAVIILYYRLCYSMYIYIYTLYTYIYIYICLYMYIHIYIYIYIIIIVAIISVIIIVTRCPSWCSRCRRPRRPRLRPRLRRLVWQAGRPALYIYIYIWLYIYIIIWLYIYIYIYIYMLGGGSGGNVYNVLCGLRDFRGPCGA